MKPDHILVIGSGSVGRRHARNLQALGCEVSCVDPRPDRLAQMAREVRTAHQFTNVDEALRRAREFSGVAVCSPPRFHVEQCEAALALGLPVLLEKPASVDAESCRRLHGTLGGHGRLLLGYTYRWCNAVRRVKALLDAGTIGPVRHARFTMSAHLSDWHPWERYQDFFMASRELGGGAILDESHFLDLMIWFFGMPERVFARIEKISDLEIDTDDLVEIMAGYPGRFRATVHLDLFGRPHEKRIVITGEKGTLECSFNPNVVRVGRTAEPTWDAEIFAADRNEMFLDVGREFLRMLNDDDHAPTCTLADGLRVLEVIEACRESQRAGSEVSVSEAQHA